MNRYRKIAAMALVTISFALAMPAGAETPTSNVSALTAQIQNLMTQIKSLQTQLEAIKTQQKMVKEELQQTILLTRQLGLGMSGEEVTSLQEILSADPEIYPEKLITGFFGPMTEKAVKRFQKKYGIEQLGLVGPKTRAAIHSYFWSFGTSTASTTLPLGLAKKLQYRYTNSPWHDDDDDEDDDDDNWVSDKKVTICHYPSGNSAARQTITIGVSAWFAHQKHGDTIGSCDGATPPVIPPVVDNTSPVISNLAASTTASTSAIVSWSTNESTKGKLWYGAATPVSTSTASLLESDTLKTNHAVNVTGLTAITTYYYFLVVSDTAGNTATSSEQSFTTPENP